MITFRPINANIPGNMLEEKILIRRLAAAEVVKNAFVKRDVIKKKFFNSLIGQPVVMVSILMKFRNVHFCPVEFMTVSIRFLVITYFISMPLNCLIICLFL